MTAYDASEWSDLFVATAGASAALAGLLFVAVSINLERILGEPGLPERGLETVMLLLGVLVVSIVGLIPGQSREALGLELLAVTLVLGYAVSRLPPVRPHSADVPRSWVVGRWALRVAGTVPLVVGAISVTIGEGGGLYWIVAGIVFAIVSAIANAWVLLVEILR